MAKFCECGCGAPAPIATETSRRSGWVKGQPKRFIHGHQIRTRREESSRRLTERLTGKFGPQHPAWRGGRARHGEGYIWLTVGYDHPMADSNGRVKEHRLVMAQAIGRPLRPEEVVHHVNGIKDDNRLENLELFSSTGEHTAHHWANGGLRPSNS